MSEHRRLLNEDPGYAARRANIESVAWAYRTGRLDVARAGITRIPVVVHVVFSTETQNISDAQIQSQIDVLNQDFRKTNLDVATVPAVWQNTAEDARIKFILAVMDPNGNPTNGITRTRTETTSFRIDQNRIKATATGGADPWPADRYLNIWVAPNLHDSQNMSVLGYGSFPGTPAEIDGVVVRHSAFGTSGTAAAPFNLGRTATHEIGHWLNLFHIWGDDGTGCNGSDKVDDTPNAAGPNFGCPIFPSVTCDNDPDGDMFMNYMDYVDDACMVMFTAGQVTRMQAAIDGPRALFDFSGGTAWGSGNWATSIAFGDVDGDGRDEIGIARKSDQNRRYWIFDDATTGFTQLLGGGAGWGSGNWATSIAFGDVDGDGLDEIGIARKSDQNARYWILDDGIAGFAELLSGGTSWGSGNWATSIAFGDVDGDGRDEIGIARQSDVNARYWILDDAVAGFTELLSGGSNWGSDYWATSIAFGDVDGDGRAEIGIARKSDENARYWILDDAVAGFTELLGGGTSWGSGNWATSIAFGDIDGDGLDEIGIARKSDQNPRYWILDDAAAGFAELLSGGAGWGSGNWATSIAFGDADGDGRAEIGIARRSTLNPRYWVLDDAVAGFTELLRGGSDWGSANWAMSIAFGNVDSDGGAEIGIARKADENARFWVKSL
jgi:Pregnancy-associated plasma protein-A/FG-GAP-like repeat